MQSRRRTDDLDRWKPKWNNRLTYPDRLSTLCGCVSRRRRTRSFRALSLGIPLKTSIRVTHRWHLTQRLHLARSNALAHDRLLGLLQILYNRGRVNDIVVDPTSTTTVLSLPTWLALAAALEDYQLLHQHTSWSPMTDDPLLATITVEPSPLTEQPQHHLRRDGDLNYGSFSMGSQGILNHQRWRKLDAARRQCVWAWLPLPAGQFPQYQAVGKVRVDPRNSSNVVAGTKTGLYFSYDGGPIDWPVHDQQLHHAAAGHHRPRTY